LFLIGGLFDNPWVQSVLLGLLQGLTEFLPVSSTAHMAIAPQLLFGMQDPGSAFSAIVQLGPIAAIIWYFRDDLSRYLRGILRTGSPGNAKNDLDARLGWFTLLGTVPGCVAGFLLESKIDNEFRRLTVIAVSLIVLAIILGIAEKVGKRNKSLEEMTLGESQVIGWAQILSLVPGTSRSGVTITAGLFQGLERESAARFSFLLGLPFITAAGLYKLAKVILAARKAGEMSDFVAFVGPYLLGAVVAGVFAYIVVHWFLGYMKKHNTGIFILYRILLGIALLLLLHFHLIKDTPRVPKGQEKPLFAQPLSGTNTPAPEPNLEP